jgi:hypothetical protein
MLGAVERGKIEPERKKSGITTKFIIIGKACISVRREAIAVPSAVKKYEVRNINPSAGNIIRGSLIRKPTMKEIISTAKPWRTATVAPPKVRPNIILNRETGATIVSFKNPNCLSQISSIPPNIAVKTIAIDIIPGAKNWR